MTDSSSTTPFSLSHALSRRSFMRKAGLMAAISPAAAAFLGFKQDASAAYTPPFSKGPDLDLAILNFALNLEYLEGEYYTRGSTGATLTDFQIPIDGSGTQGDVTIKADPLVPFESAILKQFALEIAQDEMNHIKFIRNVITSLGGTPVARPAIDLLNSFNAVSANANLGPRFDPFASEINFFLGGDSLTEVGVTAFIGSSSLISNPVVLQGAASILATEAYHAATLRTVIYSEGGARAHLISQQVNKLQDFVDDNETNGTAQGVIDGDGNANIVPTDGNSLAWARDPRQVLNVVYTAFGAPYGGFFPNGTNGIIT